MQHLADRRADDAVVAIMLNKNGSFGCAQVKDNVVYHLPGDFHSTPEDLLNAVSSQLNPMRIILYNDSEEILKLEDDGEVELIRRDFTGSVSSSLSMVCVAELTNEFHIAKAEYFTLDSYLWIDKDSQDALDIHDGIYSLLSSLLCTKAGVNQLKAWMHVPSCCKSELNTRYDLVEVLVRDENCLNELREILQGIKSLKSLLQSTCVWRSVNCWESVLKTCNQLGRLSLLIRNSFDVQAHPLLASLVQLIDTNALKDASQLINCVIDFEPTGYASIKAGQDQQLDAYKRRVTVLGDTLTQILYEKCSAVSVHQSSAQIKYVAQLGYFLITVADHSDAFGHLMEFQFSDETYYYFKDSDLQALDDEFGEIEDLILDRELDILQEVQLRVVEGCNSLESVELEIAKLDVLQSYAMLSIRHQCTRPNIGVNDYQIHEGRHILHEVACNDFVANDLQFQSDVRGLILTGPNGSGKSVYLKQVALIQYFAQIGCFVPASNAHLPLMNKLITRLKTVESASNQKSAFKIDLDQIKLMLKLSDSKSLFVIDEFGKGTDVADGTGLLVGILHHLLGSSAPHHPYILCATHLHFALKDSFISSISHRLCFGYMQVVVEQDDHHQGTDSLSRIKALACGRIKKLFKLASGCSDGSFGIHCAYETGIPTAIIERALTINLKIMQGDPIDPLLSEEDQLREMTNIKILDLFLSREPDTDMLEDFTKTLGDDQ
ncbi:hypothetical protein MP228_012054 [Amoeboaphelidium protococcarum]|nr:hypothetical protein MP228_012054 [Amoeboaphelidium protococcarum]